MSSMEESTSCWGRYSCIFSFVFALLTCFALFGWHAITDDNHASFMKTLLRNSGGITDQQTKGAAALAAQHQVQDDGIAIKGEVRDREEVLDLLINLDVYSEDDFVNSLGINPPYWDFRKNSTTALPGQPRSTTTPEWGPCFAPHSKTNWTRAIQLQDHDEVSYNSAAVTATTPTKVQNDWASFCRPGFIIIGAGKCGTSSLYHYLTDHPKVLPASSKQIHYFKYYAKRSMRWYLRHFPKASSFLASGALITGEASPGYLPYPEVANMVRDRLPDGPRIVAIGREPIDRAYSSYRYNYVNPTLQAMKLGRHKDIIKHGQNDTYYEQYLFSFEDMLRAELRTLRECLAIPNGIGVTEARKKWGQQDWTQQEYDRRDKLGLDPLVDLDGYCYGKQVSKTVPRRQWAELLEKYPEKVIEKKNLHLVQSFIGRSLYALPLEWWYAVFDKSDVYFVCMEELTDMTGEPLNQLGQFLGLPSYNFSESVQQGAYNVGGHRGYDKETSWKEMASEEQESSSTSIPISDEFRKELEDFIRPYNERLFQLVGRRCDWDYTNK